MVQQQSRSIADPQTVTHDIIVTPYFLQFFLKNQSGIVDEVAHVLSTNSAFVGKRKQASNRNTSIASF